MNLARQFERRIEHVPVATAFGRYADDLRHAMCVLEGRSVADLTAATRVKGRARQQDGARPRIDYARFELEQIRLFMAKIVGHCGQPARQVHEFR
jgi:hypothetical protein